MTKMKKMLWVLLAALLLITPLAACSDSDDEDDEDTEETEVVDEDEEDEEEDDEDDEEDDEARVDTDDGLIAGIPADTVMLEIEGESVYWTEVYYDLQDCRYTLEYYYGVEDWDDIFEDDYYGEYLTYNEFALAYAVDNALERRAVIQVFEEQGIELDEDTYLNTKDDYIEYYGLTDETYIEFLDGNYLTEDLFEYINYNMAMYYQLMDELYGENGEDCPPEEVEAFVESNELVKAKHILFKTVDDDYEALSDEEIAAAATQADELYAQLEGLTGDELLETFDELMTEYSEDPGSESYPDGYVYSPGTMMTEFEETAEALEEGAVAAPVETDYGYHIILRLPISWDDVVYGTSYTVGALTASERTESVVGNLKDSLDYTETDAFGDIVPSDIFVIVDAEEALEAAEDEDDTTDDVEDADDEEEEEEDDAEADDEEDDEADEEE